MSEISPKTSVSRRAFVGLTAAGLAALTTGATSLAQPAAAPVTPVKPTGTIRDRLVIFTTPAGSSNSHMELGNVRGGSRMTPAEGAAYLAVPNLILVRNRDLPALPSAQQWRARTEYQQYAISFRPLKKVIWSIVGSQGKGGVSEVPYVVALAKEFPNIGGIFLDDFILEAKRRPDGRRVGRPALNLEELQSARDQLRAVNHPMEIWLTVYTTQLLKKHSNYTESEPGIQEFLPHFDMLTLWTWNANELTQLEEAMTALEAIAPKTAQKALGLYLWDYPNRRPVPLDLMKYQCELGLKWLRAGRVQNLIFLSSTLLDMGLDSVEFARKWIAEIGDQPL